MKSKVSGIFHFVKQSLHQKKSLAIAAPLVAVLLLAFAFGLVQPKAQPEPATVNQPLVEAESKEVAGADTTKEPSVQSENQQQPTQNTQQATTTQRTSPNQVPTPTPATPPPSIPFRIHGTTALTVPRGELCTFGFARTNDTSKVTWQLASPAAAWTGETPEKYPHAHIYMYVDKPSNPADGVTFCIKADYDVSNLNKTFEFYLHISDPSRGIDQVFTVRATVIAS